jgi:hypothetical protein
MIPRKWPTPSAGQLLRVGKPSSDGWIAAYFWPSGGGVHFVFQAINHLHSPRPMMILDASDEPLAPRWIAAIGTTHMLGRGATVDLIQLADDIRDQLEGWRAEVSARVRALRLAHTVHPQKRHDVR